MKAHIAGLSFIAASAIAAIGPLSAAPQVDKPGIETRIDEASSVQRQQRRVKRRAAPIVSQAPVYSAPRYRSAADPSIGPDGRPYQKPSYLVGCVIDEGYGRWSACSNR